MCWECRKCNNTGKIAGIGGVSELCLSWQCRFDSKAKEIFFTVKNWVCRNPFKTDPMLVTVSFFIITIILSCCYREVWAFTLLASSYGSIFVALKYKLDEANYNKDLFEKRYEVFSVIDKVLWDYYHPSNDQVNSVASYKTWKDDLIKEIDFIWRKSYFLFGRETSAFIKKFRTSIVDGNSYGHSVGEGYSLQESKANEFMANLLDGIDTLPENFPELKISLHSQKRIKRVPERSTQV
ncbi:MAG: hypothetical protein V4496_06090 [Pseudomonadota bacterium]